MAAYTLPVSRWFYQGQPAASGTVTVYQTLTTTPVTIYTNGNLSTPASNPLTLDANGECKFYVSTNTPLRLEVKTSGGTLIQSVDPVYPVPDMTGFLGTGADLNKIYNITNGTAAANKALVTDSNINVGNVATETADTASTRLANMTAVQASQTGGFVNRFRNATFDVAQRGTAGSVTTGNSNYTVDGWILSPTGATAVWSHAFGGGVPGNSLTINAASGMTGLSVKQRIESHLCYPLSGQQVTVTFVVFQSAQSSITPTLTVKRADAENNWSSSTTDVNAVSLQAVPISTIATVSYTFTANALSRNGLEITLDFGAGGNAASGVIGIYRADIRKTPGVSSGPNSNPPVMERRPYPLELLFCQRYYVNSFPTGTAPAQNAGTTGAYFFPQVVGASTALSGTPKYVFPTRMRASPTITRYNPSAANSQIRNTTQSADFSGSATTADEQGVYFAGTSPGGSAAGDLCAVHFQATAEL